LGRASPPALCTVRGKVGPKFVGPSPSDSSKFYHLLSIFLKNAILFHFSFNSMCTGPNTFHTGRARTHELLIPRPVVCQADRGPFWPPGVNFTPRGELYP
jgi:hypothetical protein